MATLGNEKESRLKSAVYAGVGVFFLVFVIFILSDMSAATFLKWGLGLGILGFLVRLSGIGNFLYALLAGAMGQ